SRGSAARLSRHLRCVLLQCRPATASRPKSHRICVILQDAPPVRWDHARRTSRATRMSNPRHWTLSAALVLAASAGCGDAGNSQPPLPLGESNAAAVAAEVLITLGQNSFSVRLPSGVT